MKAESGVTLIELLLAITMMTGVLLATFAVLNGFQNATRANFAQNHAQSQARGAIDRLARELRNAASPQIQSAPIERADADELLFLTVDPSGPGTGANTAGIQRVRYCLKTGADRQELWRQTQTWGTARPPPPPAPADCPHSTFGSSTLITDMVARKTAQGGPLFTYDAGSAADVTAVTMELYTDTDANRPPSAQRLRTTVYLRNRNRFPVARFSATPTGSQHVLLNGAGSTDPDGDALNYTWYDGSTFIGTGVLLDYAAPTAGTHTLSMTVTDSAGLSNTAPAQEVRL